MKIALTVKGSGLGAWLDDGFADCGHVMVVDEDLQFESWENPGNKGKTDPSERLVNSIISKDVDFLITGKISPSDKKRLDEVGVNVVENKSGTVINLLDELSNM